MIPRITIPDTDDEGLVAQALIMFAEESVNRIQMGDERRIEQLRRASELLSEIYNAAVAPKAAAEFGPVPSDADIAKALDEFGGENPTGNN